MGRRISYTIGMTDLVRRIRSHACLDAAADTAFQFARLESSAMGGYPMISKSSIDRSVPRTCSEAGTGSFP